MSSTSTQWLRYCRLVVSTESADGSNEQSLQAIDLSNFRIRFLVDQALAGKPTTAEITIYNVAKSTVDQIPVPTNQNVQNSNIIVSLEAGYENNHAVIFRGELWWKTVGRENETDTFMALVCASGNRCQNYSVVNVSIPKGATQNEILGIVAQTMKQNATNMTEIGSLMQTRLPRGKVIYKMTKDAMQGIADTNNFDWCIGTNGLIAVRKDTSATDQEIASAIVLNARTGMIGRPKMTSVGLNVECLLNPQIDVGTVIRINNSQIQRDSYDTSYSAYSENLPRTNIYEDIYGFYRVIARQHLGDTLGNDWYTSLICTALTGTQPINSSVYNFFPNT